MLIPCDEHSVIAVMDRCDALWDIQMVLTSWDYIMTGSPVNIALRQNCKCALLSLPCEHELFQTLFSNWNGKHIHPMTATTYQRPY